MEDAYDQQPINQSRLRGTVKWFDEDKGFGFIDVDGEDEDVFVHYSDISMQGFKSLNEGDEVSFDKTRGPKGLKAIDVQKVTRSQ